MLRHFITAFCVISTTAYAVFDDYSTYLDGDSNELRWSESYTVKATSISLMSNIEEDYTVWKTNATSRVDCNKGAFKVITRIEDSGNHTYKMIIRPETTENKLNEIKCHLLSNKTELVELDDILPRVDRDKYVVIGDNETLENGIETTKFEFTNYDAEYKNDNIIVTLWAAYSKDYGWTPVRLDGKKYNGVLENLIKHDIWNFYDYHPDVIDGQNVFDPYKNGCVKSETIEHTADSEKVTKELYFIDPENNEHVDHVFNHFKNKFNRQYKENIEHEQRKAIFRENMRLISSVNRRNLTYTLGINEFADWTPEEKQMTLGILPEPLDEVKNKSTTIPFPYDEIELNKALKKLPKDYDMRVLGLISPVKNQEYCGSCWTFAAAAVVESALARTNGGNVLGLSNQAIIDCAYYDGIGNISAGGCQGGVDYVAYDFIKRRGLPTEREYGPYKMMDGFCNIDNMNTTYKIKDYKWVTKNNTSAMKLAVFEHGPLFIYVNVTDEFFLYSKGIFYQSKEKCLERTNHAVAMVGYGEIDGETYFILKNSYGVFWGNDGYMFISARDNVCGVKSKPSYPVF